MPTKKYLIAIVLPEPLLTQVEEIKLNLLNTHSLKGALRCPAHITLHRPFEWKVEKEERLIEMLNTFRCEKPFKIQLLNFSFFEPRVIYVNVIENDVLNDLHSQLKLFAKRNLQIFNEYDDVRAFKPHVTIASRDLKKALFYELKPIFEAKQLEASFDCSGFTLLRLENKWEKKIDFAF